MKLIVIVNYDVILTHFVDTLSCWDIHVEKYVRTYFESEFGLTKNDEYLLKEYVDLRKPLGWKSETELLDWARNGYPDISKFNKLLPIIKYFENKKNNSNILLSSFLKDKTELIKANGYEQISETFLIKDTKKLQLLENLFNVEISNVALPCYLTYSPDENWTMGGANGEGIYIELKNSEIKAKRPLDDVILHEFLHKRIAPSKYFKQNVKQIALNANAEASLIGYPDRFINLIEESIVYALCEIFRQSKTTPSEKVQFFKDRNRPEMVTLWNTVKDIMTTLQSYLNEDLNIAITRNALTNYFTNLLAQNIVKE